jgi:hypothetical protein
MNLPRLTMTISRLSISATPDQSDFNATPGQTDFNNLLPDDVGRSYHDNDADYRYHEEHVSDPFAKKNLLERGDAGSGSGSDSDSSSGSDSDESSRKSCGEGPLRYQDGMNQSLSSP